MKNKNRSYLNLINALIYSLNAVSKLQSQRRRKQALDVYKSSGREK